MILRRPLTEKLLEKYEKALNTEPVFTEYEQFRLKFETDLDELQKSGNFNIFIVFILQ